MYDKCTIYHQHSPQFIAYIFKAHTIYGNRLKSLFTILQPHGVAVFMIVNVVLEYGLSAQS